jgi:hypothetical protein
MSSRKIDEDIQRLAKQTQLVDPGFVTVEYEETIIHGRDF